VEDHGSTPVNRIFRLYEGISDDSNTPNRVKKLLVSRIILRITARISYEHNVLSRFVLHLIWLIIQEKSLDLLGQNFSTLKHWERGLAPGTLSVGP